MEHKKGKRWFELEQHEKMLDSTLRKDELREKDGGEGEHQANQLRYIMRWKVKWN